MTATALNLEVGTEVVFTETVTTITDYAPGRVIKGKFTSHKHGTVVEVGTGSNEGRVRVRWSHCEWTNRDGTPGRREDGKRTWMKVSRLALKS